MTEEVLDIVNENDIVIGSLSRKEVYKKKLSNFRVINAFIVNQENKIFVPRRNHHKSIFPLCLDSSIGGHVSSGESYLEAFLRETEEEVFLKDFTYVELMDMNPHTHEVGAFMKVYLIKHEGGDVKYSDNDFCEHFWLTPTELLEKLKNGDKSKSDLPPILRELEKYFESGATYETIF